MWYRMLLVFGVVQIIALAAQPLAAQEPPAPTRVAVINMGEIFRNYVKAKEGKRDLDAAVAPYKKLLEQLREETDRLQQVVRDPKVEPEEKTRASTKQVALRRQMEDLSAEAQKVVGKKSEQFLIDFYGELEAAVQRYADAHQIDLVLVYGESKQEDRLKYQNLTRKFTAADQGGVVPIFVRPRIDITQAVLKALNEAVSTKK